MGEYLKCETIDKINRMRYRRDSWLPQINLDNQDNYRLYSMIICLEEFLLDVTKDECSEILSYETLNNLFEAIAHFEDWLTKYWLKEQRIIKGNCYE
jgi:hypothetical protein